MTEGDWFDCTDPLPMLRYLDRKVSDRKIRLFTVACCRQIWYLLATDECRHAVEVSERFADDSSALAELRAALQVVHNQKVDLRGYVRESGARGRAAYDIAWLTGAQHAQEVAKCAHTLAARSGKRIGHCKILRDIFGNPFHPVTLDPAWLRWNGGLIRQAAQRIYDDRAFDDLPILGDALEDAGCRDADILEHCRRPGEHVRGCWVVDLLLGKE